jgi:hypothetical protein
MRNPFFWISMNHLYKRLDDNLLKTQRESTIFNRLLYLISYCRIKPVPGQGKSQCIKEYFRNKRVFFVLI